MFTEADNQKCFIAMWKHLGKVNSGLAESAVFFFFFVNVIFTLLGFGPLTFLCESSFFKNLPYWNWQLCVKVANEWIYFLLSLFICKRSSCQARTFFKFASITLRNVLSGNLRILSVKEKGEVAKFYNDVSSFFFFKIELVLVKTFSNFWG